MSALFGILGLAVLFVAFGLLPRGPAACDGCAGDCDSCPVEGEEGT